MKPNPVQLYLFVFVCHQDSGIDIGDIKERKALRKKLQCKTFRWYLVNIYPEMRMYTDTIAYGVVSICIKSSEAEAIVNAQHIKRANKEFKYSVYSVRLIHFPAVQIKSCCNKTLKVKRLVQSEQWQLQDSFSPHG